MLLMNTVTLVFVFTEEVQHLHEVNSIVMPRWAEPRRHTVVVLCVCVCVCVCVCLSRLFLWNG